MGFDFGDVMQDIIAPVAGVVSGIATMNPAVGFAVFSGLESIGGGIEAQAQSDRLANQQDSIAVLQAQAHQMNAQDIKDVSDRNYSRALKDAADLDSIKTLNDSIFDENSKVIQYAYGVQIENIGLETNRLTSAQTAKYASVGADLSAGSPLMEVQNAKELMERQVLITKQNELNEMEKNAMQEKVTDEQFNAQIDKMKDEAESIKLEGTAGYNREMLQAQIALSGGEATADYTRAGGQQSLFKGVAGGISSLGGAYLKAFPPTTTPSVPSASFPTTAGVSGIQVEGGTPQSNSTDLSQQNSLQAPRLNPAKLIA